MPRSVEDGDGRLHLKLDEILMKHLLEDEVVHLKPYMRSLPPLVHLWCLITVQLLRDWSGTRARTFRTPFIRARWSVST